MRRERLLTVVFWPDRKSVVEGECGRRLQCGRPGFQLWVGKIPWRRDRLPTPVFLPGDYGERIGYPLRYSWASLVAQAVKNLPAMQETLGQFLGWSLQHQTLLLSPVTSTAGYSFCFGSIPSFFLELFLTDLQIGKSTRLNSSHTLASRMPSSA